MRVRDWKLNHYWKSYIKDLSWDLQIREGAILRSCLQWGNPPDCYKLRQYKNMRHYILDHCLSIIGLGLSLSSHVDKKSREHWLERRQTVLRLIEDAKSNKRYSV